MSRDPAEKAFEAAESILEKLSVEDYVHEMEKLADFAQTAADAAKEDKDYLS